MDSLLALALLLTLTLTLTLTRTLSLTSLLADFFRDEPHSRAIVFVSRRAPNYYYSLLRVC